MDRGAPAPRRPTFVSSLRFHLCGPSKKLLRANFTHTKKRRYHVKRSSNCCDAFPCNYQVDGPKGDVRVLPRQAIARSYRVMTEAGPESRSEMAHEKRSTWFVLSSKRATLKHVQKQRAQGERSGAAIIAGQMQRSRGRLCPLFGFPLELGENPSKNGKWNSRIKL